MGIVPRLYKVLSLVIIVSSWANQTLFKGNIKPVGKINSDINNIGTNLPGF